ncbi:MAG: Gfo/Idh/MocA family oxidoreductase [Bacteroidales bacterium]|nr:Gfo/Idh/MocA family oxidoreductase [Bacteroidales bacterium]
MPVRLAAVGLGNRTTKYLKYVKDHPERVVLTYVADIDEHRVETVRRQFGLPRERCFAGGELLLAAAPEDIDAVIIGSPDFTHRDFALEAISHSYHVLLEKPVGLDASQTREIADAARDAGVLIGVCYVLRYKKYYSTLRRLSRRENLGGLISISHTTDIGVDRTLHSYVRGPWNVREMGSPVFLSKCCHDVDIALWLTDAKPVSVLSRTAARFFVAENAPSEAADRCLDCPLEGECPYSAVDLYLRRHDWIAGFMAREGESLDDAILRELKESRYGRCAFKCGNDAFECQDVFVQMSDGTTVSIKMDSLTGDDNRVTVLKFRGGTITADERKITVHYHNGDPDEVYDFSASYRAPLHGNADLNLIEAFITALESGSADSYYDENPDSTVIRTSPEKLIESHLVCFAAEESRRNGNIVYL